MERHPSPAEMDVLVFIAQGFTSEEIADHLGKAYDTVRTQRQNLLARMHARNTAHAVAIAYDNGWLLPRKEERDDGPGVAPAVSRVGGPRRQDAEAEVPTVRRDRGPAALADGPREVRGDAEGVRAEARRLRGAYEFHCFDKTLKSRWRWTLALKVRVHDLRHTEPT